MATRASIAAKSAEPELVLTRIFDAPRRVVFKAWTQPERAAQWWGPLGFTTISCEMDVRPGGLWRRCMRSPEGIDFWRHGVYREVVEPERLVFTYVSEEPTGIPGHQTLVTVTFAEFGEKTELTLHQAVFESVAARDAHQDGWASCLERFAQYLAKPLSRA